MGTNIALSSESFAKASDKSWLGTRKGLQDMRSITLDLSLFDDEHVAGGYLPSGIALAKVTATGLYGPYSPLLSNGLEDFAGLLFEETKVVDKDTDPNCGAALYWTGVVKKSKLPTFTGTGNLLGEVDAAAETASASWIRWEA